MTDHPDGAVAGLPTDPDAVYHLITPEGWETAQDHGSVVPPGFAEEGFVHCSTGAQLAGTIERHFAGHHELVLLQLHVDRLGSELVWEEGRPGQLFPHLYRPVALDDVAAVVPWHRS